LKLIEKSGMIATVNSNKCLYYMKIDYKIMIAKILYYEELFYKLFFSDKER